MPNTFEELVKKTDKLKSGYNGMVHSVLVQLEPYFIELNKKQMLEGYDANGDNLPMYRNPMYKDYKDSIGCKSLPYMDFKDTGAFYRSLAANTDDDGTEIFATDIKAPKLEALAGDADNLYGVQQKNLETLKQKAIELMANEIKEYIGL